MKLFFQQKFFSFLDAYDIYDESGAVIFSVKSEFTFGRLLKIYDANQKHVASLEKVVFSFPTTFKILIDSICIGEIKKEFTFFKPKFTLSVKGWTVDGDFLGWDYKIYNNGTPIASIQKELLRLTDTYTIDVYDDENILYALLIVLTIDAIKDDNSKHAN